MTGRTSCFAAAAFALGAIGLGLAGCGTGARPSLGATTVPLGGTTGTPTTNAAVDAVLQRLEATPQSTFTARYAITRKLGPNTTTGTVVHDGATTSVTVGDVRFLQGAQAYTCSLSQQRCEDGTLDARISDFSVSSDFYAAGPARSLRLAYARRRGEPTAATQAIGGVAATCATVPVGSGAETYCATDHGAVARWDTAAVNVELQAMEPTADPAAFALPGR